MSSVFSMVKQVLADSKEKIASQVPQTVQPAVQLQSGGNSYPESGQDAEKVAKALEYLADNIHLVVDQRSPQEKLAEYHAISQALAKHAMGDEDQGPHQTQEAPSSYQSPMSPGTSGDQVGAGSNQMSSDGNARSTDGVLEAGQTGEATSAKINPMSVSPGESAFPGDEAGSALETTQDDRPGSGEAPEKIAQRRAQHLAHLVAEGKVSEKTAAYIITQDRMKVAGIVDTALSKGDKALRAVGKKIVKGMPATGGRPSEKAVKAKAMKERLAGGAALGGGALALGGGAYGASKALAEKQSSAPPSMAWALINKLAADAENPASISAGSNPELQTASGANPAQSQGHEAGESTPATKGSDQGRAALQSVKDAINATKDQLKGSRTRSEMGRYLDEPAFSQSHDRVLQQSLENASSAGVKIAATKAMLQKWASSSPERAERLQMAISRVKMAMPEGDPAAMGAMPPMAPGEAAPVSVPAPGEGAEPDVTGAEPVSDAALAAAAQGVTPEDLEMAEAMLEEQMGAAEGMAGEEAMGYPEAEGAPVEPPAPPAA